MMFLKIVGGVAVGVLVALAILVVTAKWWLAMLTRRWAKGLTGIAGAAGLLPPPRIKLVPRRDLEWDDDETLERETQTLEAAGFERAGDFSVVQMHGVRVRGLAHTRDHVLAAITEHPAAGIFSDIVQVYDDDTSITVTSSPETGLEPPPWKTEVREVDTDAARLWTLFGEHRLAATPRTVSVEAFASEFEAAYAREMSYHVDRGGPGEDEIREMARLGGDDATDEAISAVQGVWNNRVRGMLERELRTSFIAATAMSAAEWEDARERLVIVHEHSGVDELEERISDSLSWDDEDAAQAIHDAASAARGETTGREAFALMNATLPESTRFEKVGELTDPVGADVYLEPPEDDELAAAA